MSLRHHLMALHGVSPTDKRTLSVQTFSGEVLPDMTITATEGFRTTCHPSHWSLFRAADYAAKILGRRDLWVGYRAAAD